MDKSRLEQAVLTIKSSVDKSITTRSYNNKKYPTGLEAKNALIRSSTIIQLIHEAAKEGLDKELKDRGIENRIYPPLGATKPEKGVWGLLKKKQQDVVVLVGNTTPKSEIIGEGPLKGEKDMLGREATKQAIVLGVRSQLSSIAKNYDTLIERALAETVNLRLRHPYLVMGEVFLLAVKEYDTAAMRGNRIAWNTQSVNVARFISAFDALSGRDNQDDSRQQHKYENSALLLVDFSQSPPKIYWNLDELRADAVIKQDFSVDYSKLSPLGFSKSLVDSYLVRHPDQKTTISSTSQKLKPKS